MNATLYYPGAAYALWRAWAADVRDRETGHPAGAMASILCAALDAWKSLSNLPITGRPLNRDTALEAGIGQAIFRLLIVYQVAPPR